MTHDRSIEETKRAYIGSAYQKRLFNPRPREVCRDIGLNWLAALRLRDSGWLSFDPEAKTELEDPDEAELRFIGALVVCGFDENQLSMFLKDLSKPYRYRIEQMYFDFVVQKWRMIPRILDITGMRELIDTLKQEGEIDDLRCLNEQIAEALEELESRENDGDEEEK